MILVTGGSGFVGGALLQSLVGQGQRVAVLTRSPERLRARLAQVEIRGGDLLDPSSLTRALDGVETVVHLAAALPGPAQTPDAVRRTNVDGTANLARAAARAAVRQFVLGSSAGVYGDGATADPRDESSPVAPRTPYERSKLDAERAATAELSHTPVSWIILRPSGVHGPGRPASADFVRQVRRKPVWLHGPAVVLVHPTYVLDVVSALTLSIGRLDMSSSVFNVAGPRALTYRELIDTVARRLGLRARHVQLPPRLTRTAARAACAAAGRLGRHPESLARLTLTVVNRTVDITKARRVLGFEPVPLEEGLDATIAWARKERLL